MPLQPREQQIMRAAEHLFSSRRFHEVTMDDICRSAGVGKGTIYRFFKDKDDLFFRLVLSAFDDLCQLIRATSQGNAGFEEQLRRVLSEMRSFFDRKQEMLRLMQSDERNMARHRKTICADGWTAGRNSSAPCRTSCGGASRSGPFARIYRTGSWPAACWAWSAASPRIRTATPKRTDRSSS